MLGDFGVVFLEERVDSKLFRDDEVGPDARRSREIVSTKRGRGRYAREAEGTRGTRRRRAAHARRLM